MATRFKNTKSAKAKPADQTDGPRLSSRLDVAWKRYFKSVSTGEIHCITGMQTFKFEGKRASKNGPIIQVEEPYKIYQVIFRLAGNLHHGPFQASKFEESAYAPQVPSKYACWEDIHAVQAGIWVAIDYYENKPVKKRTGLFV